MKISAIICEFNPLHNGHDYIIKQARKLSGCDALVVIMSGSFTQRGEICRTDKFLRAKHAILSGADAVVELPASFSVAPAEIFARGAVKLISGLNTEITLAFGCESGNAKNFINAAESLSDENDTFKKILAERLDAGESYIRSYSAAYSACGGDANFISSPNNILGIEYAKATMNAANVTLLPVKRIGAGFNDGELKENYSSAGAIRANPSDLRVARNMPEFSYNDFISSRDNKERFESLAADWLFTCDKSRLSRIFGCSEGLENRLKNIVNDNCGIGYADIVALASSKRYSSARIRRILCANLLGLYADDTREFLNAELPLRILAVDKRSADKILPLLSKTAAETPQAQACADLTSNSYALWRRLSAPLLLDNPSEKMILI